MALPTDEQEWVTYLSQVHDHELRELKALNDEYELRSPRMYMHPEIFREIGDRLQQVVIAWPMLVVDSLEERLDVEGFRLPDDDTADDDLWRVWQENNLDEASQLAHLDALVMKRAYVVVGTNEDDPDTPLVTCESPLEVYADIDPRNRNVRAALRRYQSAGSYARETEYLATLYLPDKTIHYERSGPSGQYDEVDRDQHNLGVAPVTPLVNRSRLADWCGRSELAPILPLAHAANKIATDMMVGAEFVALPLRGIFGIGPADLEDEGGHRMTALQAILGRLLTIPGDDQTGGQAREFEFTSADLTNFHDTLNQLARLAASIAGLPAHYVGLNTENPPSADAIRSSEIRLIKRAERKQRPFGGTWERTNRIVRRFQTGEWDPALRRLETIWRDPSTPTVAQKADAAVKLYNLPAPIVPLEMTREKLGFTSAERARMRQEDALAAAQQAAMFEAQTAAEQMGTAGGDANQPAA
ncbi:phage portal protein [Dactylosporangium roseum]|uniref:Phage portal protein n=1 Tax=Dactylosporangium roseum TaxID=47989 RepID=A0ABY5Z7D9_9ACTN|nr:phage portal protein [Dactylosporangium roseum]UWZ37501.1 phage portal protein [Dactylosporangium roseum]